MKCAGELITISLENAEKKRIREEQERLERERVAAERLRILKEKTVNWCEKIGEILEKKAIDSQPLEYDVILCNSFENVYFTYKKVPSRYSDNRDDYDINWSEEIHLPTIIEFFKKYCFEVSFCNTWVYRYRNGECKALKLFIKPAPQCF